MNTPFGAAVHEFGIALKKTASIRHRGNKGGAREEHLRAFLRERLPTRYAVTEGEVVDLNGQTSPQLDLMIYDQSINFALNGDGTQILPAEAPLAKKTSSKPRYYHCVFSYAPDLSGADWVSHEAPRFSTCYGNDHLIDCVYVLNKGLLNVAAKMGMQEDDTGAWQPAGSLRVLRSARGDNDSDRWLDQVIRWKSKA